MNKDIIQIGDSFHYQLLSYNKGHWTSILTEQE